MKKIPIFLIGYEDLLDLCRPADRGTSLENTRLMWDHLERDLKQSTVYCR